MSFTSLPVEVVSEIFGYLQLSELRDLRLSCRALHRLSLVDSRYFKSIHFIVTSDSLRELEALAEKDIRGRVQELWMIPSVFDGSHAESESAISEFAVSSKSCQPVSGDELRTRFSTYKCLVADNSRLLESEALSNQLSRCLEKFDNLTTIGLAHYSTSFLLDPRQERVRFLGWRHLINQIDFRFGSKNLEPLHGTGSVMAKINSLAASKLLQALSLSRNHRKIRKLQTCNPDYCGNIAPDILLTAQQYSSLLSTLVDLEDLHVCTAFRTTKPAYVMDTPTWINLFIHVAPCLERLTISQDYYIGELSSRIQFNRLKELHLHKTWVNSEDLKSLLMKAKKNLAIFSLFQVIIEDIPLSSLPDFSSIWYTKTPDWLDPNPPQPLHTTTNIYDPFFTIPADYNYTPTFVGDSPSSTAFDPTSPAYTPTSPAYTPNLTAWGPNALAHTPNFPAFNTDSEPSINHEDVLWKSIWNFFGDNLSLKRFSMAKIAHGTRQISIQSTSTNGLIELSDDAVFDARISGLSFHEWIRQITPIHSLDSPHIDTWPSDNQSE